MQQPGRERLPAAKANQSSLSRCICQVLVAAAIKLQSPAHQVVSSVSVTSSAQVTFRAVVMICCWILGKSYKRIQECFSRMKTVGLLITSCNTCKISSSLFPSLQKFCCLTPWNLCSIIQLYYWKWVSSSILHKLIINSKTVVLVVVAHYISGCSDRYFLNPHYSRHVAVLASLLFAHPS